MTNCSLCGGSFYRKVLLDNSLLYDHCKECRSFSQRSASSLSDIFMRSQESYHAGNPEDIFSEPPSLSHERWSFRAKLCNGNLIKNSNILEIGPGSGKLADVLINDGYKYTGCEHSPSFANYLSDKGLDIIIGSFEDVNFDTNFDAIISMHVIEHLCSPQQHLEKAYEATRPGGKMILCTPNANSLYHKLPDKFSSNFDEAHLYVFSSSSLKYMAEKIGWRVEKISTHEYTSDWLRLVSRLLRIIKKENAGTTAGNYAKRANNPIIDRFIGITSMFTAPFRWLQGISGLGNELIFVLKK